VRSPFGIEHGEITKAEPTDLGGFREKKRKARAKAFFERPDISSQIDEVFKPPPHKKFSDTSGGVTIHYQRPDGSITSAPPKAAPEVPAASKGGSKVKLALAGGAAAAATGGSVALNRKRTRAARRPKKAKSAFGVQHA
jgi:hypothetical protein